MAVTLTSFREQFPTEFSATTDATVERAIKNAQAIHCIDDLATLYLTAHLLTLESDDTTQPDGGYGEVSGEGVGPMRTNYVTMAQSEGEAFFTTTSYGRLFFTLERRTASRGLSARVW